jgi:hypothetical protein
MSTILSASGTAEQARLRAHHELAAIHRIRQDAADEQYDDLRNPAR